MVLKYEFAVREIPIYRNDWDVEYDVDYAAFEYKPDHSDILAFYHQLSKADFVDAGKHAFEKLSEEDKAFVLDPDNGYAQPEYMNGNEFNWAAIYADVDNNDDFISNIMVADSEYLEDELHDYFEADAREDFEEQDY